MGWSAPVLIGLGRALLGTLLAGILSVVGIGIAGGGFVFFGAVSHTTLLFLFMTGAGIGAGVGSIGAWLRIDRAPPLPMLLGTGLVLVLAGIGGAWGGFQVGAAQDVECCVGPTISPITFTALGATVGSNVAAVAVVVGQGIRSRMRRAKDNRGRESSHPSASNDATTLIR